MKVYHSTFAILLVFIGTQAFSQSTDSIFEKDIFLIRSYGKKGFVKPDPMDSIKPGQKSFNVRYDDGPIRYSVVPDPGKWRIALYIGDRLDNECYYYNDIFIIQNFNDGFSVPEADDFFRAELNANKVYLKVTNGNVAKMWRIKARWKRKTVKEKPDWFKGWVTSLLEFEVYHIYTLHEMISMKAVTTDEGDHSVTVGRNVRLGSPN
ncbi:hypothetical protein SAMN05421820_107208 [Pedobacter steynii]|uniref:Uncharacterized protein n=1 Tax=Pedobacter steynii TaxID=430522 RepID=A0A1H0AVS5_9SPHI|nr:hypothetical protein [Pedobacter steynii]NQX41255.1 hypothetical protein [Pedobacter steynii]SDN37153.1 hypothetical protein SAMN05421820_107208 [Pedobacter steynii]